MTHRWETLDRAKKVCVNCGWIRCHRMDGRYHDTWFERDGKLKHKTPECDGWPSNWYVERRYYLFLDDMREPPKVIGRAWIVVRNYDEAVAYVERHGLPQYISFDHDLGDPEAKTGKDFAQWLVDQHLDGVRLIPNTFTYQVHSANPVGAANITGLLDSFMQFLEIEEHNKKEG